MRPVCLGLLVAVVDLFRMIFVSTVYSPQQESCSGVDVLRLVINEDKK